MFGRRVPPHIVFALSLLLAASCGAGAYALLGAGKVVWGVVVVVLALWFAVDAVRSYAWAQARKRQDAERAAQDQPRR